MDPGGPRLGATASHAEARPFDLAPEVALGLLMVAGVACWVAMSMPQVHIAAYCADLGSGPRRGAEMVAMMLSFGRPHRL